MDIDNLAHWLIAILWIASLFLIWTAARKRGEGETLLSKLFTSNKDLDSTLRIVLGGVIVFAVLAIVVVFFSMFHDDLDKSHVGMLASQVIMMAGASITAVIGNGNKPDKPKD